MSRPLRSTYPGAFYHITSRGDRRGKIYRNNADRRTFNRLLGAVVKRCGWRIHAYCQMTNHYHLLVETPEPNLVSGMVQLNGRYANYFNRAHGRVGHVFQGRYIAINVQQEHYLLELARYVVLNPVRARMIRCVQDWQWSSYQETVGVRNPEDWSTCDTILSLFGSRRKQAVAAYARFVAEGINAPSPWTALRNGIYLGNDEFVDGLLSKLDANEILDEIPKIQRSRTTKSLQEWEACSSSRDNAIRGAYASGGYT